MKKVFLSISILAFSLSFTSCDTAKKAVNQMTSQNTSTTPLIETHWKLIELVGQEVKEINGKEPYIMLSKDNRISANAGCNNMGGSYETNPTTSTIKFSQMMMTKMACADMLTEQTLAEILAKTDSYILKDDILILTKARMAPLARFQAVAH